MRKEDSFTDHLTPMQFMELDARYAKINEAMGGYEKQAKITDIMESVAGLIA